MKIQPEFNIAAILSKISVADVVSQQVLREGSDTSPFETYFEAALQQIDDPQLAATIATLNKSGMIVPDSSEAFLVSDPGLLSLEQLNASEAFPAFRTLQLLNGRSVITSHVALNDPFTAPADLAAMDAAGANPSISGDATVSQSAALNAPPAVAIELPFVSRRQTTEEWLGGAGKSLGTHAALASFPLSPAPRVAAVAGTPATSTTAVTVAAVSSQIAQALQSRQAPAVPRFEREPQVTEFEQAPQATEFEPSAQAPHSVRAAQVSQLGRSAIAAQMSPTPPVTTAAQALQSRQAPSVPRFEQEPQVAEFEQAPQATEFDPSAQAPHSVRAAQVPQPGRAAIAAQMPTTPPVTTAAQALQSRQAPSVTRFEQTPQVAEFEQAPQATEFDPSAQAPQSVRAAQVSQLGRAAIDAQMSPTPPVTTAAQALQSTTPLVTPTVQAPATLQTTVIPQGQVINPDQPASQAAPAAQEQVINAMERRQSTEAWLANPARMSTLASTLSQVKAPLPVGAPGLQFSKLTRPVMQTEPVGRAEMVESVERRMMAESWLSNAGKGLPVAGAALKMTQPALPVLNMLDSAAMVPLSLPESSGALGSSPSQPMTLNPVALPAQAAANVNRAPDRWMHVDDLGKQFGSVIQSSLLNRSVAGQTSLRIILSPENMGSIEAEIIDNNHTVTVNLLAQSDEVVRMLRDNSQALRDALGQSGTFELNIQKDRSGPDAQQSRDSSSSNGNRNNSQTTGLGLESTETAKNAKSASDTGALDTYV